jgi:hypothetical protein
MPYTPISAVLTPEQYSTIIGQLVGARTALSFLQTLTPADRRRLPKMGRNRVGFVDAARRTVQQFPQIMSGTFSTAEYMKDQTLFDLLVQIRDVVSSFLSDADDTVLGLGSELWTQSLKIYKAAQDNVATVPGLKPLHDEMRAYFERGPEDDEPAPPTPPTA